MSFARYPLFGDYYTYAYPAYSSYYYYPNVLVFPTTLAADVDYYNPRINFFAMPEKAPAVLPPEAPVKKQTRRRVVRAAVVRKLDYVCSDWTKDGVCPRGKSCCYEHPTPNLDTSAPAVEEMSRLFTLYLKK